MTGPCFVDTNVLTEDLQAGQIFDGVRVVDPFAAPERTPQQVLESLDSHDGAPPAAR